ncbi:hypothetical protein dsx2_3072 [Desulfovibrio sp. X2]|uniref:NAD(P)-dependent oxidoreductase n=1 Tax=Desulfovibrio sp. X2 TaxID=941449 RepID=UPI0003588A22|nr:NAD(P)-dependent oxidoreductase [Desulfovibrio sp. X2]EPR41722.1 hypothetical protein dsx2_3072 [Desulfovibrio sp. X2]
MKIAIIGATGRVGSRIAAEALSRGHQVTGIVRHPHAAKAPEGVRLVVADARDSAELAMQLAGHDAVVSAANFAVLTAEPLLEAVRSAGITRLFVVGGAGSLEVVPGRLVVDEPSFPAEFLAEAVPGKEFLDALRTVDDLDWTFLSPPAEFAPGERTGTYRTGGDQLLTDDTGRSRISMEDYAIAALDELEHPRHVKQRFTVAR